VLLVRLSNASNTWLLPLEMALPESSLERWNHCNKFERNTRTNITIYLSHELTIQYE
jgi:hypothetical protein